MSEINHFKKIILCSDDMTADVNHLHIKRIYLETLFDHLYIIREDTGKVHIYVLSESNI
jgi:hypothetical protein